MVVVKVVPRLRPPRTQASWWAGQAGGGDSSRLSSLQARRVSAPITSPQAGSYFDLKTRVQNKLLAELDPSMDISKTDEVRRTIQDFLNKSYRRKYCSLQA